MGNKELTNQDAKQFFRKLAKLMDKHKMSFHRDWYHYPIGFERKDDERDTLFPMTYYFMYLDGYLEQAKEG